MIKIILKWFISALSLYIVSLVYAGVQLTDFASALVAVVIIGLVNAVIKPVLLFFTLPITIITLGLFTFVINALLLLLAAALTPGFEVTGLVAALVGSILLTIVSTLLHSLVR